MHLSRIYLNYFRNIESATIDFGRGVKRNVTAYLILPAETAA